jgi:hypothetical protein
MFGILLCRSVENKISMNRRCKDVLNDGKGYIIVLTDSDFSVLLELKGNDDDKGIDDFMSRKLDELVM